MGTDNRRARSAEPVLAAERGKLLRVLVVDADPPLQGLLEEWLGALGCRVVQEDDAGAQKDCDLVIVDVPFPRQGGLDVLKRVSGERPGTPILAISSNFFAGIERTGAVARALGVAGVLPIPVEREALIAAIGTLLPALQAAAAQ